MLHKPETTVDPQHIQQRLWMTAMVAGDEAALGKLYDATLGKVYSLALRITGKAESAEEVTSDVYLQAYREAARFDAERGVVIAWLMMLTRSRALDHLRRRDIAESYLLRMAAGARLPAHDHAEDEACMVLEDDVRLGNTHAFVGDYHLARRGIPHAEIHRKPDACCFCAGPNSRRSPIYKVPRQFIFGLFLLGIVGPSSASDYVAPAWLPGGHVQTIYASVFIRVPPVHYRRERLELPDGDFLDFDWIDSDPHAPLVVLFHGLEGNSSSGYARSLMRRVKARGWNGVVAHFRGTSGEDNRLPRAYYAGDSEEIDRILHHVKTRSPAQPLYAVGVSLGGNALLKWLGEKGEAARELVSAAAGVSAPLDLTAAGYALDSGFNRHIYTARFLVTLKAKALRKAAHYPDLLDAEAIRTATTFREFDTLVTARLHGFVDADDYWFRVSSKPWLKSIRVPTLVLNARNDPFLPADALPGLDGVSDVVTLEQPETGGHVAFPSGPFPGTMEWLPQRLLQHFDTISSERRQQSAN